MKRHTELGGISTYPTQSALDFLQQVPMQPALDGLDEVRLIMGYVWDPDTRSIGPAVISLRADRDTVLWMEELSAPAPGTASGGSEATTPLPPRPEPDTPRIDVQSDVEPEATGDDV
ncbi:MAG: hypothetical protein ABR608_00955 [Pseudonocardiaceae bacterium]